MKYRKFYAVLVLVIALSGSAAGFFAARELFSDMPKIAEGPYFQELQEARSEEQGEEGKETRSVPTATIQKITPSTKMVYQYYYEEDGILEEQEEEPPYFLLDLTLQDMKEYYPNWTVMSFSDREVVMRQTIQGKSSQHYIVGVKDGYIAVFYEEAQNGISLHQITDTPVESLTHEEQVRLNDGIYVEGDGELARVLEDYES